MWTDKQLDLLIKERENKNAEYHNIPGSDRVEFWKAIAETINKQFKTGFSGEQCKNRFRTLVRDYNVSIFP